MADDKSKVGHPDKDLISLTQDYERRDWAKKFGVSEAKLKEAVAAVGHSAKKVEERLKKNK
ncbi:DUF3606 domain-containing protein [Yersinia ruckeri]|uniref:DUF3606 domain-containing protein n=1 Tax=Yersinia ruckeri TaxID=29486 RepID=UPI0005391126|nr:DUF3606 domain-containing protein [Yersinia ruckeri]AUQ42324.1 DUF3606 domain-containing protein [Yersinia ruckeri]WMS04030.1 DUF3606 domain-containing protein [Yersinia ruckeri]